MARLWGALAVVVLALLACTPGTALGAWTAPVSQTERPPQLRLSPRQATAIALRTKEARRERASSGRLRATAVYDIVKLRWQVDLRRASKVVIRAEIDDRSRRVIGVWKGDQIEWELARGDGGLFGRRLNAPYIWLPLCLLFVAPFFDFRRPFRLLHLDLLAVLAFGVSHIWFDKGQIDVSVPLAYPVLAYLFGRMLWLALRGRGSPGPLIPHVPVAVLVVGLVFLLTFRVGLNVVDSGVTDVGYAGVIGADRIVSGDPLYGGTFPETNPFGNTYGSVNYLAYIPFEQAFPWSGRWDELPAAHAATIAFDLLVVLALFALGRRVRRGRDGTTLGVALGFAWVACPYTAFVTQSNTNDALVALLIVLALLAFQKPARAGAFTALAGAAKFVPFLLLPLMARGLSGRRLVHYALAATAVVLAAFVPFVIEAGLRQVWDVTIGAQVGRDSPFSIWGQHHALKPLLRVLQVALVGLALAAPFVGRRRHDLASTAAYGAALIVLLEIVLEHWFYFYILWFLPLLLVALFAKTGEDGAAEPSAAGAAREPVRAGELART